MIHNMPPFFQDFLKDTTFPPLMQANPGGPKGRTEEKGDN